MEKLYCRTCEEFKDEAHVYTRGTNYYEFRNGEYEYVDSGDTEEDDAGWWCPDCYEELEMKEFKTNEWQGAEKK